MKTFITLVEGYFRKIFGLLFPVLITLGVVFAALHFSEVRQTAETTRKRNLWREKAEITLAALRSNHTFADLVTESGNRLAAELEIAFDGQFKAAGFVELLGRHFAEGFFDDQTLVWFFRVENGRVRSETAPGLTSTRLRIMQKVFTTLHEFSNNPNISQNQINSEEKFVKSVFGLQSAPLSLGRRREGRLTPVTFEGRKYFFYWRQYQQQGQTVAGTAMLLPGARNDNIEGILKIFADRVFAETDRHLAVAFIPSEHLKTKLNRVFPTLVSRDADYLQKLNEQIDRLLWVSDDKGNVVHETNDHLFLRGFLTADNPFDAVIFAPRPADLQSSHFSFLPVAGLTAIFWAGIYLLLFLINGRPGLPMAVSFRILFFFSGLLPIFLMLSSGFSLIDESYNNEIYELRQQNSARLYSINEKSDGLLPLFGYHIQEMLKVPRIQKLLADGDPQNIRSAFFAIRNQLQSLELSLDYLFAYFPGQNSEMVVADQRIRQSVKVNMNLTAPGVFSINRAFSQLLPRPDIILDPAQSNFHKIMSGVNSNFLEDTFNLSYEKENYLKNGDLGRDYHFTVILCQQSQISSYLVFAANSENMFRKFLARELSAQNISDSHIFLTAEELANADFKLFPRTRGQVLTSQINRKALNFLKKCRGSIFEKHITDQNNLYLFYPMNKMPGYAGGCIISLADANRSRQEKQLLLAVLAVLLACLMYVAASFATTRLLVPLENILGILQRVSAGHLDQKITVAHSDELGLLGNTINMMLEGFKERLRLGKFVSTTLDRSLSGGLSLEDLKKARTISGTVLFSDIRSFTTMSEAYPPVEVAAMLNAHLEAMSEQIQQLGGQIEQFIGDAIVAFFPDRIDSDSKSMAIKAALNVHQAYLLLNASRQQQGRFTYAIGIGLQHGTVITGSLVTPERCEFSIIGAARREAEEFEALSKLGSHTRIIVSQVFIETLKGENLADYCPLADTGTFELCERTTRL